MMDDILDMRGCIVYHVYAICMDSVVCIHIVCGIDYGLYVGIIKNVLYSAFCKNEACV